MTYEQWCKATPQEREAANNIQVDFTVAFYAWTLAIPSQERIDREKKEPKK
jgi:hypothetical protein